jgi:hypothetical protein
VPCSCIAASPPASPLLRRRSLLQFKRRVCTSPVDLGAMPVAGYVVSDNAAADAGLESTVSLGEDLMLTVADFGMAGEKPFEAPPADLLATSAGMRALRAHDRAMLQKSSVLVATRR